MALAPEVVALISDPDSGVRLQAMLTAGLLLRSGVEGGGALRDAAMSAVVAAVAHGSAGESPAAPESADEEPPFARSTNGTLPSPESTDGTPGSPATVGEERWLRLAAVSVLAGDPVPSLEALLTTGGVANDVVERVATLLPAERLGEIVDDRLVQRALREAAAGGAGTGRALLAGLTAAAAGAGGAGLDAGELAGPLRRLRRSNDDPLAAAAWRMTAALGAEAPAEEIALLDCAGVRAADGARDVGERLEALALFGLRRFWPGSAEDGGVPCPESRANPDAAVRGGSWLERMGSLTDAGNPAAVQRASMAELAAAAVQRTAMAELAAAEAAVTAYVVDRWPYLGPAARRDAGGYLIRGRGRHGALLDALESGRIRLGEMNFDLERRRFLLRSPDSDVRRRAAALFDDAGVATRADAIAAMRPALELEGNPERGEALFLDLCARCHQAGAMGAGPGPSLDGIGRKSAETLLHDILDPNAAVDAAYVNYIVETPEGEVFSGILAERAGGGVMLRAAEDAVIEISAERIREVRSDGLSMMPEELEAGLEPGDVADLLAFLRRA